jgi:hypothetical protein
MAERNCIGCGDKIGYERNFYRDGEDLIHATCAENPPDDAPAPSSIPSFSSFRIGAAPRDSPAYRLGVVGLNWREGTARA